MQNLKSVLSSALSHAYETYQKLDRPFPVEEEADTALAPAQPSDDVRAYRCALLH